MEMLTREQAGLKPPKRKPAQLNLDEVQAISLHCQGIANVGSKWVKRNLYWINAVQRGHMKKWSDIAYSFAISRTGQVVAARGLDMQPFGEGAVQHNRGYTWDYPNFLTRGESGNPYFISICLVTVGIASGNVRPYDYNGETHSSTKGQWIPPSLAQMEALDWLIPHIRREVNSHLPVHGHGGHRIKPCPGPHLWEHILNQRWGRGGVAMTPTPTPPLTIDPIDPYDRIYNLLNQIRTEVDILSS